MMATKRSKRKRERVSARRRVEEHKAGGNISKYLNHPDGFGFFAPKAGKYRLDFLPYRVGKGNPYADDGGEHYERTFYIHKDIGPNNEWHLCAAKTLGKPCPICEFRAKRARDPNADDDQLKPLLPKQRQLFFVIDLENPDEKLLWNYSFHSFGDKLDAKIRDADEEDGYDYFADPEEGKTVRVVFTQAQKGKWLDCTDIEFKERKTQYDPSIIDELPCLDDLLVATPYEVLEAEFLQIETEEEDDEAEVEVEEDDGEEEEEEAKPEKKSRKPKKEKILTASDKGLEVGDAVSSKSDSENFTIFKISKDGTSLTLEDAEGDLIKAIGVDEVNFIKKKDDDDEEPAPKVPKKKPSKSKPKPISKAVKEDDDDDDDEDEMDEDEEWDEDFDDD